MMNKLGTLILMVAMSAANAFAVTQYTFTTVYGGVHATQTTLSVNTNFFTSMAITDDQSSVLVYKSASPGFPLGLVAWVTGSMTNGDLDNGADFGPGGDFNLVGRADDVNYGVIRLLGSFVNAHWRVFAGPNGTHLYTLNGVMDGVVTIQDGVKVCSGKMTFSARTINAEKLLWSQMDNNHRQLQYLVVNADSCSGKK